VKAAAIWQASRPASSGNRAAQCWLVKWATRGPDHKVLASVRTQVSASASRRRDDPPRGLFSQPALPAHLTSACRYPKMQSMLAQGRPASRETWGMVGIHDITEVIRCRRVLDLFERRRPW